MAIEQLNGLQRRIVSTYFCAVWKGLLLMITNDFSKMDLASAVPFFVVDIIVSVWGYEFRNEDEIGALGAP
jgi:hypothetical protein